MWGIQNSILSFSMYCQCIRYNIHLGMLYGSSYHWVNGDPWSRTPKSTHDPLGLKQIKADLLMKNSRPHSLILDGHCVVYVDEKLLSLLSTEFPSKTVVSIESRKFNIFELGQKLCA